MKRKLPYTIIQTLLILSLLLLCGCTGAKPVTDPTPAPEDTGGPEITQISPEITQGSHEYEDGYAASFRTHMLSAEGFTLHVDDLVYEEPALLRAAETLSADLTALETAARAEPAAVTVYVVNSVLGGCPQRVGTEVFCTLEELESGAYRDALTGAAYALPCEWQRAGLSELAFGEDADAALRDYYACGAHALTASCSAIHLSPVLSDAETVAAARDTARSLCSFLIGGEGFPTFRDASDPWTAIPAWAESIGISPAPAAPEGSEQAAELTLGMKAGFVCELRIRNFTVTLSDNSWLLDPDGLYSWFCRFFAGMDMVFERIGEEAPSALPVAEERYAEPIQIDFRDINNPTGAYPKRNTIELTKDTAIWHEMVHLLLEEYDIREDQSWIEEAVADRFSYAAQSRFSPTRYYADGFDVYLSFFEDVSGKEPEEDDMLFHRQVWTLYEAFRSADIDADDNEAYCRAYGIVSLISGGKLNRTQLRMLYDLSVAYKRGGKEGSKKYRGSALTYPEAAVVLDYMCTRFGTDAVIANHLNGVSLKGAFGLTYSDIYRDAVDFYTQEYGALLPTE